MKRLRQFIIAYFVIISSLSAKTFDFRAKVSELQALELSEFLQQFPIGDYWKSYPLHQVDSLEAHRLYLIKKGISGDDFLMVVFENYMKATILDFTDKERINSLFQLAELHKYAENYWPENSLIYSAASDFIFATIADSLTVLIEDEKVDRADFYIQYLVQRLADHKYIIAVPTSNWTKLWNYTKAGRWDYIWHKFTSTYFKEFLLALGIGVVGLSLCTWIWIRYRKKKQIVAIEESN